MTSTATKEAREVAVVTKAELVELREYEDDLAKFKKKASEAEKQVKFRRQAIVEKVISLLPEAALKVLPLEKVQKLFARRQANETWELGKVFSVFAFDEAHSGRCR